MINHPYKLLVVDIDGTLLGSDGSISVEDREALAKASHSGVQVSLSTGRVIKACLSIIDQLSLDGYHIFFDGALVGSPEQNKEIYVQPISEVMVRQMVEFAHRHDINLELYSATRYFAERESWSTDIRREFFGIQATIIDLAKLWRKERIIKGTLTVTSAEERAKADRFYLQFKDSLNFTWTKSLAYPDVDFINILDPEVSKGKALEALASHLGVSLAEVMAVGDGANDIPLLSLVGLAVAMGNAPDKVKAIAHHITLDADHSGLAAAINKFLL